MIICPNCGQQNGDDVQVCFACGTVLAVQSSDDEDTRKTVSKRKIRKCPNCGEVIDSFTAKCPACGFEINDQKVSSVLQDFIKEINECEKDIANSSGPVKTGWSTWSKGIRVLWVVINIMFMCVPLVIYFFALPLLTLKLTPKLTAEEKKMASLIENFPFPNDRESILSALFFAEEKIDFISKESINAKTAYWMRLWCAKAEQLKSKSEILFPDDSIVTECYDEICADKRQVDRVIKIKAIIGLVILVLAVACGIKIYNDRIVITDGRDYSSSIEWKTTDLFAELPEPSIKNGKIVMETSNQLNIELYNIEAEGFEAYVKSCIDAGFEIDAMKTVYTFYAKNQNSYALDISYTYTKKLMRVIVSYAEPEKNEQADSDEETTFTAMNVKNITFNIPDYWEEEGSKNEYLQYYAEKGDKVVMMSISYPKETDDNYDVSFEGLDADRDNMSRAVAGMFTGGDVVDYEDFESDYGIKGILYHFTYKQRIDRIKMVDGSGYCFCFPSGIDRRWFYVVLLHTDNVPSNDYKKDYMDMLKNIKEKE